MEIESALYRGSVQHRHYKDLSHRFSYPIALMWIDLSELDVIDRISPWFSVQRFNLCHWRRRDYIGDAKVAPAEAVREVIRDQIGDEAGSRVCMLTHPAHLGFCFNPVTFYYCFDDSSLTHVVAEITNTPWKERHQYAFRFGDERFSEFRFAKQFHVSPFLPMGLDYHWRFERPGPNLRVHMNVLSSGSRAFDATLSMSRQPMNAATLRHYVFSEMAASARVLWRIHWQALRLWLKKAPVFDHPKKDSPS